MARAARGDAAALHAFRARHETTVYALAYGILGDSVDAEHVVAETFLAASRASPRRPSQPVRAWLGALARARSLALLDTRTVG